MTRTPTDSIRSPTSAEMDAPAGAGLRPPGSLAPPKRPQLLRPDGSGASQTDWSVIHAAVAAEGDEAAQAWEAIATRYWPAIYAYARRFGFAPDDAADLTQAFVCDVVIGRSLLAVAAPERGRFRALLRTALRHYITESHRHRTRLRRHPRGSTIVPLDAHTMNATEAPSRSPEAAFDREWAIALVRRVLEQVRQCCLEDGLDLHWKLFEVRVARLMLSGEPSPAYPALLAQLGDDASRIDDPGQAANMVVTVKRRMARALREEVQATVAAPDELEDELGVLLGALEGER